MIPFLPIQQKNDQVDGNNNNLGESNMIMEKVIKYLLNLWEYKYK